MIDLDTKEIEKLTDDLERMARHSIPFAGREALTQIAFKARRISQNTIGQKFIERNQWTRRSVRASKAKGNSINTMSSEVGSTEGYMREQEFGSVQTSKGKHGMPIPTSSSAGQSRARPRTALPRPMNKMARIKLQRFRQKGKTPNQRLVVAVAMAVRNKRRHVFLELGKHKMRKGMYRVIGGRYKGRGWPGNAKLEMVHDMTHYFVRIGPTPWLGPSVMVAMLRLGEEYEKALRFQLRRAQMA